MRDGACMHAKAEEMFSKMLHWSRQISKRWTSILGSANATQNAFFLKKGYGYMPIENRLIVSVSFFSLFVLVK
jgi:hypothetical protein